MLTVYELSQGVTQFVTSPNDIHRYCPASLKERYSYRKFVDCAFPQIHPSFVANSIITSSRLVDFFSLSSASGAVAMNRKDECGHPKAISNIHDVPDTCRWDL
jgi:hypothetical protein